MLGARHKKEPHSVYLYRVKFVWVDHVDFGMFHLIQSLKGIRIGGLQTLLRTVA